MENKQKNIKEDERRRRENAEVLGIKRSRRASSRSARRQGSLAASALHSGFRK